MIYHIFYKMIPVLYYNLHHQILSPPHSDEQNNNQEISDNYTLHTEPLSSEEKKRIKNKKKKERQKQKKKVHNLSLS